MVLLQMFIPTFTHSHFIFSVPQFPGWNLDNNWLLVTQYCVVHDMISVSWHWHWWRCDVWQHCTMFAWQLHDHSSRVASLPEPDILTGILLQNANLQHLYFSPLSLFYINVPTIRFKFWPKLTRILVCMIVYECWVPIKVSKPANRRNLTGDSLLDGQ